MRISELDDIDKAVLLGKVVERARADLNDGRPLTEMRSSEQIEIEDDLRCRECGSTEAGNCFYCKAD